MTNLSDYFPPKYPAVVYTPVMMYYNGSGGISITSKVITANLVTFICVIQADSIPGTNQNIVFNAGAGSGSPLLVYTYPDSYTDSTLRKKVTFDVRNTGGTKIAFLVSDVEVMDGNKHTILFAYDANNGTAVLYIDGVNADDLSHAARVTPVTGTIPTGNQTWRAGLAWWSTSNYFTGYIGALGFSSVYITNPSTFFDSDNNIIKLDEDTWLEWGGIQPLIYNEHGDLLNNKGSFGGFVGSGDRQRVSDEPVISTFFES